MSRVTIVCWDWLVRTLTIADSGGRGALSIAGPRWEPQIAGVLLITFHLVPGAPRNSLLCSHCTDGTDGPRGSRTEEQKGPQAAERRLKMGNNH